MKEDSRLHSIFPSFCSSTESWSRSGGQYFGRRMWGLGFYHKKDRASQLTISLIKMVLFPLDKLCPGRTWGFLRFRRFSLTQINDFVETKEFSLSQYIYIPFFISFLSDSSSLFFFLVINLVQVFLPVFLSHQECSFDFTLIILPSLENTLRQRIERDWEA